MKKIAPLSKNLKKLIKSLSRKKIRELEGLFLCEGEKICREAFESSAGVRYVVVTEDADEKLLKLAEALGRRGAEVFATSETQFQRISDAASPQKILAVAEIPKPRKPIGNSFVLLDSVQDPGNFGTIARVCDWFGIENLLHYGVCADPRNPKTVRSTMGSIFRVNFLHIENPSEVSKMFPEVKIFGAALDGNLVLGDFIPPKNFGLAFGSESRGFSEEISQVINDKFLIPGAGKAESLNVSTACAISVYAFATPIEKRF